MIVIYLLIFIADIVVLFLERTITNQQTITVGTLFFVNIIILIAFIIMSTREMKEVFKISLKEMLWKGMLFSFFMSLLKLV